MVHQMHTVDQDQETTYSPGHVQEIETNHDCELGKVSDCVGAEQSSFDIDGHDQSEFHQIHGEGDDDVPVPLMNENLDNDLQANVSGIDNEVVLWVGESGLQVSRSDGDVTRYGSENDVALLSGNDAAASQVSEVADRSTTLMDPVPRLKIVNKFQNST